MTNGPQRFQAWKYGSRLKHLIRLLQPLAEQCNCQDKCVPKCNLGTRERGSATHDGGQGLDQRTLSGYALPWR